MESKEYFQNQFDQNYYNRVAVLLVNFGGPTSLKAIKPFLYNLFSDPMVLDFPLSFLYRKPLAWLIANLRYKASKEMYKKIGGITPLISISYLQAQKLQELFNKNSLLIDVFVGFRYSKPYMEDVISGISKKGYKRLIILTLYPQYSFSTVGSAKLIVENWAKLNKEINMELHFVNDWYKDEDFINAHTDLIQNSLSHLDLRQTEIIFSAHSIPVLHMKKGDPYKCQIEDSTKTIIKKLEWKKRWYIAYQSKIGPIGWLGPSMDEVIKEIATRKQNTNIVVVPISFTSEHVETIFEIGKLYKSLANKYGIKKFCRTPALNTNRFLIQALYNQVMSVLASSDKDICKTLFALK